MKKTGPIIVIEDDLEDQEVLNEIFVTLNYPNKVIFFTDGNEAINYLNETEEHPFIILSDINMPKIDGFQVRNRISTNEKLSLKCIPYLFFTTGVDKKAVHDAYAMSVQGFFIKPGTMAELHNTIKKIIEYWQECYAPSQFN
jgi:CheY-like chemotaxis protein